MLVLLELLDPVPVSVSRPEKQKGVRPIFFIVFEIILCFS